MAYEQLEGPVGEGRSDYRMAVIASILAEQVRDPKKRKKPYAPKDFLPNWKKPTDEELVTKSKGIFAVIAARLKGNG